MPVPIPSVVETRADLADFLRSALATALGERLQVVPSGEWEGVPVVTEVDVNAAIAETFERPLPRHSSRHAEVETRGEVVVTAVCPLCQMTAEMLLTVDVELHASGSSRSLHLKASSKARAHVCGQESLPLAKLAEADGPTPIADGQMGIEELVGERCPNPGCILPADHEGGHVRSAADQEADPDGPTLDEVSDIEGLPQDALDDDDEPGRDSGNTILDAGRLGEDPLDDDDLLPE